MSIRAIGKYTDKKYSYTEYECDVCGYRGSMRSDHFKEGVGCSACSGKQVFIGFNDFATTDPDVAKYVFPPEVAQTVTRKSHKKVTVKCDICGAEHMQFVSDLCNRGFNCRICGRGNSFPNRLMFSLLRFFVVNCNTECMFEWSGKYRYDFYLPDQNLMIEMQGSQHYKQRNGWTDLEEIQFRDEDKYRLAMENGIRKYFCIPAVQSDPEYLKESILTSGVLQELHIELDDKSWSEIVSMAYSNVAKRCLELWNTGNKNIDSIAESVGLCHATVYGYLSEYAKLGLCDYDPLKQQEKNRLLAVTAHKKPVICVNDGSVFESIRVASILRGISETSIQNCVAGRTRSAGKDAEGNKLIWKYITLRS